MSSEFKSLKIRQGNFNTQIFLFFPFYLQKMQQLTAQEEKNFATCGGVERENQKYHHLKNQKKKGRKKASLCRQRFIWTRSSHKQNSMLFIKENSLSLLINFKSFNIINSLVDRKQPH